MNKITSTLAGALLLTSVSTIALAQSPGAGGAPAEKGGSMEKGGATLPNVDKGAPAEKMDKQDSPAAKDRDGPPKRGDTATDKSAPQKPSTSAEGKDDGTKKRDTAADKDSKSPSAAEGKSGGDTGTEAKKEGSDKAGSAAQLSGEQKTKVVSSFRSHKQKSVSKSEINISISVGVAVPRSVTLYAVPEDVVVIVPAYRRYKYFIFEDEVVIVDPDTYEVVEVIVLA